MCEFKTNEDIKNLIERAFDRANKALMNEGHISLDEVQKNIYDELGIVIFTEPWTDHDFAPLDISIENMIKANKKHEIEFKSLTKAYDDMEKAFESYKNNVKGE